MGDDKSRVLEPFWIEVLSKNLFHSLWVFFVIGIDPYHYRQIYRFLSFKYCNIPEPAKQYINFKAALLKDSQFQVAQSVQYTTFDLYCSNRLTISWRVRLFFNSEVSIFHLTYISCKEMKRKYPKSQCAWFKQWPCVFTADAQAGRSMPRTRYI